MSGKLVVMHSDIVSMALASVAIALVSEYSHSEYSQHTGVAYRVGKGGDELGYSKHGH